MSQPLGVKPLFTSRQVARCSSSVLAVAGWAWAAWSYLDHGFTAGIHPGFIAALSVGICFTIVAGQWFLIPTKAEIQLEILAAQAAYGSGYKDGLNCGACPLRPEPQERKTLGLVRG
jgi:hypothetical protein